MSCIKFISFLNATLLKSLSLILISGFLMSLSKCRKDDECPQITKADTDMIGFDQNLKSLNYINLILNDTIKISDLNFNYRAGKVGYSSKCFKDLMVQGNLNNQYVKSLQISITSEFDTTFWFSIGCINAYIKKGDVPDSNTMIVNNKQYLNCYAYSLDTIGFDWNKCKIYKIVYSKENGLIAMYTNKSSLPYVYLK